MLIHQNKIKKERKVGNLSGYDICQRMQQLAQIAMYFAPTKQRHKGFRV
jgi:hypothetical protein